MNRLLYFSLAKVYRIQLAILILLFHVSHSAIAQNEYPIEVDSFLQLAKTTDNNALKAKYYNAISFLLIEYNPVEGIAFAQKALDIAKTAQSPETVANAYNNLANNHAYLANFDSSRWYYHQALVVYEETSNQKGTADVLGNIGQIDYYISDFENALMHFFRSLEIFEKLENKAGKANTYTSIGNVYMEQKQFDQALKYDSLSLYYYKEIGDISGEALVYGNLANIFEDMGQREQAIKCYEMAISIYEKLKQNSGLGRNLSNLSTLYQNVKDYVKSLELLNRAFECFSKINYGEGLVLTTGNIGISYLLSYKYRNKPDSVISLLPGNSTYLLKQAERYLLKCVEWGRELNMLNSVSFFSKELALVYEQLNDFPNAFKFLSIHHETKDSVFSAESKVKIENLTTERELALKNKQIEIDKLAVEKKRNERIYFILGICLLLFAVLFIYRNYRNQKHSNIILSDLNLQIEGSHLELEQKNKDLKITLSELRETQDQLIQSEKQKENAILRSKISQDIHDDISSGLTKISWLAESLKIKNNISLDLNLVEKINMFSRESVTKLGEIIWSTNPERDDLNSLLSYTRTFLYKYLEDTGFQYQIDFPEPIPHIQLNPELRRNLFLVFKECVHNAVKYSKGNLIKIGLQINNNTFEFEISDNGTGMGDAEIKGSGNGLINMQKRMAAVGGNVRFESSFEKGTRVFFNGIFYV
ncbi:MAG: tetratricopeptide repeat protein [Saprospiraceae bacterium]|nr:tetratricopeptide repeat protein [Saprospiraceae bacterium]